ncbi:hypothetical protein COCOBI_01-6960 [Coccomyxa sp. Obi]|nr:hypothetical protein COCOBI_01-6920 [Coccomyxa sp. Obi]BDA41041.1 hypothetical protein COCOBI_01-6960 [Coccomyxa sp. Obi]
MEPAEAAAAGAGSEQPPDSAEEGNNLAEEAGTLPVGRAARKRAGDPRPKGERRKHITKTLKTIKKRLREEKQACGHQAAYLCIFAAVTSERGIEDVTTVIEASDDCILASAGCTFDAGGQPQLHRHFQAGLVQALAREKDLDRVREIKEKEARHFSNKTALMSHLRDLVKRRVNDERRRAGESEEAQIYSRVSQPTWWPTGWDWSSRALEAAAREDMDRFYITMRDWHAQAEERDIEEDVQKRRGLHPSSQRRAAVEPSMEDGGGAGAQGAAGRQQSGSTGSMESARSFSDGEGEHNEGVNSRGPAAQGSRQAAMRTRGGSVVGRGGRGQIYGSGRGRGRGRGSNVSAVPPILEESSPAAHLGQQAQEERSSSHARHDSGLVRAAAAERGRRGRGGLQNRGNQGVAGGFVSHREATTTVANVTEGPIAQQRPSLDGDRLAGDSGGLRGRGSRGGRGGTTRASMQRNPPMHAASRRTLDQGQLSRKRRASGGEAQEARPQRLRRPTEKAAGAKQPRRRKRRRLKKIYDKEDFLEEETVASDGEELFRPLGINRNTQADVSEDEALLEPLNIGSHSPGTRRSKRNAARVQMQTTLSAGPSEGPNAAAGEEGGAEGNHDRSTVPPEVQVTAVLHKLLNSPGKEKAVLGERKKLLRKKEAGQAIGEEDLDFMSMHENLNGQDVPIIEFLMSANAFTGDGLSAMWTTLASMKNALEGT